MRRTVSLEGRYGFEAAVGFVTLIAVMIFGERGFACFSLWAISAFLKSRKPDEREIQLMHKASTAVLVSLFLFMYLVYLFLRSSDWIVILASSMLFFHGLWNFLMLKLG